MASTLLLRSSVERIKHEIYFNPIFLLRTDGKNLRKIVEIVLNKI